MPDLQIIYLFQIFKHTYNLFLYPKNYINNNNYNNNKSHLDFQNN